MDDSLHKAGEDAARHGVALSGCLLLQAANMPDQTREPRRKWRSKLASWRAGWEKETEARLAELERRRLLLRSD
ncbi:hypothetical protein D3C71_1075370 [compost metagenome]